MDVGIALRAGERSGSAEPGTKHASLRVQATISQDRDVAVNELSIKDIYEYSSHTLQKESSYFHRLSRRQRFNTILGEDQTAYLRV